MNNTILAYWMGYGERTETPSLYLSSVLPEERIIESVYRVDNDKARKLSELYSLFNIIGGLRILQEASRSGCYHCGGHFDNRLYYMLVEKTYRAEYESEKIGFITASIAGECISRLSSGTRAV